MSLKFIRLAHELGLGVGDPKEIEVVGYDVSAEDWHFVQEDTLASKGQKVIYHGALKPFESALLRSPWFHGASSHRTSTTTCTGTHLWVGRGSEAPWTRSGAASLPAMETATLSCRALSRAPRLLPPAHLAC